MKAKVYCIRDVINGFMSLTFDVNDNSAKRNFHYALSQPGMINFAPKDYDLYYMGEFDQESGEVDFGVPRLVIHGSSLIGVDYNA